ncbi:MAG: SDR family oxidoreductase [Anaerolineales bacterium]|nr:SDR family oxidoreductase [Anaerolineales bacterium]MDP3184063.1 SDR family oxidoreductase [Anaerolineales bacterium]
MPDPKFIMLIDVNDWDSIEIEQRIYDRYPDPIKARQDVERRQISGRLGASEEVREATSFLASDAASYITGSSLMVDNGMTAQLETW